MRKSKLHPKISHFIEQMLCDLNLDYRFYGEFCNYINFGVEKRIPTMGVNVTKKGMNWIYNPEFVDGLTQEEMNWVGIHEILHLMYNHPKRTKEHHNHYLANVAQDMIINDILDKDFCKKFTNRIEGCLVLPKEYDQLVQKGEAKLYFEDLYDYLIEKEEEYKQEKMENGQPQDGGDQDGDGQGQGQSQPGDGQVQGSGQSQSGEGQGEEEGDGQGGDGQETDEEQDKGQDKGQPRPDNAPDENGQYPNGKKSKVDKQLRDIFDQQEMNPDGQQTIDSHMENEVDDDIAKEIVDQIKEGLKARGLGKGNVETVLDKLEKKRKDYLKEIKRSVNTLKGSSAYKTIVRPSTIGLEGTKGKKRTAKGLNCILDTSGSMGGDFEKVLSYIFQRNIIVNLIQVDTAIQKHQEIRSMKDLKELKIKGFGGTELQPGIEYIKTQKELNGFNTIVLTDGYTDTLNFNGLPGCKRVLIISSGTECPISGSNKMPVKQIVIDRSI